MLISSLGGYDNISKKCNELVPDVSDVYLKNNFVH